MICFISLYIFHSKINILYKLRCSSEHCLESPILHYSEGNIYITFLWQCETHCWPSSLIKKKTIKIVTEWMNSLIRCHTTIILKICFSQLLRTHSTPQVNHFQCTIAKNSGSIVYWCCSFFLLNNCKFVRSFNAVKAK